MHLLTLFLFIKHSLITESLKVATLPFIQMTPQQAQHYDISYTVFKTLFNQVFLIKFFKNSCDEMQLTHLYKKFQ